MKKRDNFTLAGIGCAVVMAIIGLLSFYLFVKILMQI